MRYLSAREGRTDRTFGATFDPGHGAAPAYLGHPGGIACLGVASRAIATCAPNTEGETVTGITVGRPDGTVVPGCLVRARGNPCDLPARERQSRLPQAGGTAGLSGAQRAVPRPCRARPPRRLRRPGVTRTGAPTRIARPHGA